MSMQAIEAKLASGESIFLDGATGTELQRRGAQMGEGSWSAMATNSHADVLRQIHVDYIEAGADLITTNTFGTSRSVLGPLGQGSEVVAINQRAADIALEAREKAGAGRPVAVAGCISHWRPWNRQTLDSAVLPSAAQMEDNMAEMAEILSAAGCDLLLLEMMCHPVWGPATVGAAKGSGIPVWVGLSARVREDGVLATPGEVNVPFEEVVAPVVDKGADIFGVMHTNAGQMSTALAILKSHWRGPLMAYPDSGKGSGQGSGWAFDEELTPEVFAEACEVWASEGVQILGGCCGLWLDHLQAMMQRLQP